MPTLVVATDSQAVLDEVEAAIVRADLTLRSVRRGADVLDAVQEAKADLAVLDLQVGNMGGMAVGMHLRLEESGGRLHRVPVLMLLDRRADVFLARRSGAEGWLIKPLDSIRVRKAVDALLDGGEFHDETDRPADMGTATAGGGSAEVG